MFKKMLLAARGEVALRVLRTAKEMGISVVCVYSEEDKGHLHLALADEAYCIGPAASKDSYLNISAIVSVLSHAKCDAVHPGYGFLAESPIFAKVLEDLSVKFVGPKSTTIAKMGDKVYARKMMAENGVPIVPGSNGALESYEEAKAIAASIGYPVLLKAASGGGGKGMRKVHAEDELLSAYHACKKEALASFASDSIYLEKLIENPRHIEFQIARDSKGNCIHIGERHCSIQRNHQKLIEEAPYQAMPEGLREEMGALAKKIADIVDYENLGTVEFLLDKDNRYYFMEMNTRLQVEHPVTEMLSGMDLVREQIRIAMGLALSRKQENLVLDGHVIEVRVNAEDPINGFMPSTGRVEVIHAPGGYQTRFDSYLYAGAKVSPYYDSMLGKIICKGDTRLEAIRKMRRAIEEILITGVKSNLAYQYSILHRNQFLRDRYNTNFIPENHESIVEWIKDVEEKTYG